MGGDNIVDTFNEVTALMQDFVIIETDQRERIKASNISHKNYKNYFDMLIHLLKHTFMVLRHNPVIAEIIKEKEIIPISDPI